ncbi:MAG TPA: UPF0182 family protein [Blastocatellia bacterium]|nr:UPF0182 family protein [Blastocatellia bacterium]
MDDDRLFNVVDIKPRKRRLGLIIGVAVVLALFLFGSQLLNIYIDALWFSAVGYSKVYWYKFRLGGLLFIGFFVVSFLITRVPFFFLNKVLPELTERPKFRISSVEDIRELNFLPLIYRPGVWVLAAAVGLLSAISMSQEWPQFALYLHSQPAQVGDPIFGRDVSFYLFKLPVVELVVGWLQTISTVILIAIGAASGYVWYFEKVRGTLTADIRRRATSAISLAAAFFALVLAVGTYLDRFDLLHGRHDLFTGIDYTDANVRLMGLNAVVGLLLLAAIVAVANAFFMKRLRPLISVAAIVVVVWVLAVGVIPGTFHSFSVKPNELAKEAAFIDHNIKATRSAFAIDRFEERPFEPKPTLTLQEIEENRDTLDNVRLWDRRALQSTLSQIQEIRTYYDFRSPDVDRYTINGRLREVMLAAREMNVDQLPEQSRNWINQHVVYTHGYGVTMNTVSEFTAEGMPNLILKNMPVESSAAEIKVTRPEVYYGEESNSHVYVHTKPQGATPPEFNYPAPGNVDSYTTYESDSGIPVGGLMRQLALSLYLGDGTSLLFSNYINSESRLLMRRNVSDRVKQIAPFLLFEDDPYIVIGKDGKLYWIIDAFTTSDQYPYSTAYAVADRNVNYIRNSVKAVVDAYEGSVTFYVFEPDDPIIRAYQDIFPELFHAKSEMPQDLLAHARYPSLLVNAQASVFRLYHMQNTQTFYNHEDLWAIAAADAAQQDAEASAMQPYHVLMKLPGEPNASLEFDNILPFTPSGPGRSNMIGWMAGRGDGENYGRTLVYSFPKNVTINGPAQIRARVNQDPVLSGQMTLWNQHGSELLRGNLLVIPIADSLLYLEPFYLQAQGSASKLPELRQVAVATQDQLKAAKTFDEALALLFPSLASRQGTSAGQAATSAGQGPPASQTAAGAQQPAPGGQTASKQPAGAQPSAQGSSGEIEQLAKQAQQLLLDYERLTAEGKHREAGEKLDQLKQTLDQITRKRGQ